jgi:hypothetical protein
MKLLLSLFIFCLVATSCGNGNKIKIPVGILCKDTMVEVLTDVHLVKASQQLGMVIDTADTAKFTSIDYVWKKHHITQTDYQKSLDFYTHNTTLLDSIYENVLNNLSKQKAELLAKRPLNKK